MSGLLEIKQYINNIISKYEVYLKPLMKFLLSLVILIFINAKMGYMDKINSVPIVLIAALLCSFMPMNFIVLISAVFAVLHMYALSLECAVVVLVLFLILFLLYLRLSPKDTIAVVITPILTSMGIPYVMPVAMGLIGGPASTASVGCGVIAGCILKTINANAEALKAMENGDMAEKFRFVIDAILDDKSMILLAVAFIVTVMAVYLITKLKIRYSWPIAIVAGSVLDALIVLVGVLATDVSLSGIGIFFGTLLAIVVGFIVQFFKFNVDYLRTEKVQFEDDDYAYFVTAIPKRKAASAGGTRKGKSAASTVRKRSASTGRPTSSTARSSSHEE